MEFAGVLTWQNRIVRIRERCRDLFGRDGLALAGHPHLQRLRCDPQRVPAVSSKSDQRTGTPDQEDSKPLQAPAVDPNSPLERALAQFAAAVAGKKASNKRPAARPEPPRPRRLAPALPLWVAGRLGIRPSYEQSPLMLWWFIGVWLASGAVLPVCWLLSLAYRAASKKIGPKGLYVLSGLVSTGALILLFVSPFCDSNITMRDIPSASAVAAQAPMMSAAGAEAKRSSC